jgi:4-azaleucine resistance transporter AzlC
MLAEGRAPARRGPRSTPVRPDREPLRRDRHNGGIASRRPSTAVDRPAFRSGLRAAVPFAAAGFLLSLSFGALAVDAGFPALAPIVMSAVVFAGSAQFAALSIVTAGGGLGAAIAAAALMNSRFLPMGIALGPSLPGGPVRRGLEGQAAVDASWAMAARPDGTFDRSFLLGSTAVQYVTWVAGSLVGALGGGVIGDTDRFGLDAIYPTFFLVLLIHELRSGRGRGVAAGGALIALVLIPIAPAGVPVLAASLAALVGLHARDTPAAGDADADRGAGVDRDADVDGNADGGGNADGDRNGDGDRNADVDRDADADRNADVDGNADGGGHAVLDGNGCGTAGGRSPIGGPGTATDGPLDGDRRAGPDVGPGR